MAKKDRSRALRVALQKSTAGRAAADRQPAATRRPALNPAVVPAKSSREKSLGIAEMKERAQLANGSFSIFSVIEGGTIVQVSWMA